MLTKSANSVPLVSAQYHLADAAQVLCVSSVVCLKCCVSQVSCASGGIEFDTFIRVAAPALCIPAKSAAELQLDGMSDAILSLANANTDVVVMEHDNPELEGKVCAALNPLPAAAGAGVVSLLTHSLSLVLVVVM